jgi:hypothetical protein
LSVEGNHSSNYRKDAPPPQTKNLEGKNKGGTHQNNKGNGRNTHLNSVSSNSAQPKGRDDANKKGSPGKGKPTPKLSPKERDELLAAGKCFRCKNVGHKASDCPEGETVHVNAVSTKKKKKDITKNFAMSIEPVNFDELAFEETEALAETTEGVDSVMCNAMQIVEETGEARKPRIKFLSDLLAIGAASVLLEGVPYPGDLVDYNYPDRFVVYQFSEEKYTVLDTYAEQQFQIEAAVLRNPKLDIQNWFRKRCEEADDEFRITCWDSSEPDLNDSFYASVTEPGPSHNFELLDEAISPVPPLRTDYGKLIGLGAAQVLRENAPYPGDNGEIVPDRFCVYQISPHASAKPDCASQYYIGKP